MSDTTVSLPAHLRSTLEPLTEILPRDLHDRLSLCFLDPCSEIPHSLLLAISKWARTEAGRSQLRARGLETSDYSMISLLAGTITSPSSSFPRHVPPPDAAEMARRAASDRKAITAILNALLSIGGAGYAGWWASSRTGWRDEWRVLFALAVAAVVAISEASLYLIWQARKEKPSRQRLILRAQRRPKKEDSGDEDDAAERTAPSRDASDGLRRRQAQPTLK
ncbi:hypothetical protein JB92DRAFT_2789135 [Gautieria morchelliformis]|nr:hypothetical protein JB92DRAFT_2789135 [Gautieria morchelliformis]